MKNQLVEYTKVAALGHWLSILQFLGINQRYLDGRNHPCPACGGNDRFQYTVRGTGAEYGRFACRGLSEQGGDGFKLVMHVFNCSFIEAINLVARVLGIHQKGHLPAIPEPISQQNKIIPAATNNLHATAKKLQTIFDTSTPLAEGCKAVEYLKKRGLTIKSAIPTLRHCDALDYWYSPSELKKPIFLGKYSALVAAVHKVDGSLAGLQRIYLDNDANKLRLRAPNSNEWLSAKKLASVHTGALAGAACQLFSLGDSTQIALAEGIETALAVHQILQMQNHEMPVWSAISTSGLKSLVLPPQIKEVWIYGDNDRNDMRGINAGKVAAYQAADRFTSEGRTTKVALPHNEGEDWLDILNQWQNKGAL